MRTITINSQDLGEVGTIDTYQTFTGDQADENLISYYNEEHNTDYDYDDFEWEYDHAQIVSDLAERRSEFLESESPAIHKCIPVATGSPREYNFSTDYAMFEITYDEDIVWGYIKEHKEDYKDADIDEVKGDYIDGYVEGEYIWTHDHVYIEEQEVK